MTYWKVHSKARSTRLALEGLYQGTDAFLVGSSPALLDLDLRLLRLPGVFTVAMNNAAMVIEPQVFVCLDQSKHFNNNIFTNPRILKLINYSRHDNVVGGKLLRDFPNTLFFDLLGEDEMKMSEFCTLEGPLPFWGNTFFTALALMYQLGFRRVYLIGCTFNNRLKSYAYDHDLDDRDRVDNQDVYDDAVSKMAVLEPMLRDEGMEVITCHEHTALEGICHYIPFIDAINKCVKEATSLEFNEFIHTNSS